jgi:hypothetical protein
MTKPIRHKVYLIKALVGYLTTLSFLVCIAFIGNILDIIRITNIVAIAYLIIYLFTTLINIVFLCKKNSINDFKGILIYNAIFSFVSGIKLRIGGYLFANNLGLDLSIVYFKNPKGQGFFFHFDIFNLVIKFPDVDLHLEGFSVSINLFIWVIGGVLLLNLRRILLDNSVVNRNGFPITLE